MITSALLGPFLSFSRQAKPPHMGHIDVHQDHVVDVVGCHGEGFLAMGRSSDGELFPFQHPIAETQKKVVVDDENGDGFLGGWVDGDFVGHESISSRSNRNFSQISAMFAKR